jgi:hypothetical protein
MCYQRRRNKNIAISLEKCVFGANALIIGFMLCHLLIYHYHEPKNEKCAILAKNVYSMFIDLDHYVTITASSHVFSNTFIQKRYNFIGNMCVWSSGTDLASLALLTASGGCWRPVGGRRPAGTVSGSCRRSVGAGWGLLAACWRPAGGLLAACWRSAGAGWRLLAACWRWLALVGGFLAACWRPAGGLLAPAGGLLAACWRLVAAPSGFLAACWRWLAGCHWPAGGLLALAGGCWRLLGGLLAACWRFCWRFCWRLLAACWLYIRRFNYVFLLCMYIYMYMLRSMCII